MLLVEELLELSRIESGELPLVRQDTDIATLLGEVSQRMRSQSERTRVGLSLDVAPDSVPPASTRPASSARCSTLFRTR